MTMHLRNVAPFALIGAVALAAIFAFGTMSQKPTSSQLVLPGTISSAFS